MRSAALQGAAVVMTLFVSCLFFPCWAGVAPVVEVSNLEVSEALRSSITHDTESRLGNTLHIRLPHILMIRTWNHVDNQTDVVPEAKVPKVGRRDLAQKLITCGQFSLLSSSFLTWHRQR